VSVGQAVRGGLGHLGQGGRVSIILVLSHTSTGDKHKFPLVKIFVDIVLIFIKRDAISSRAFLKPSSCWWRTKSCVRRRSSPILCKDTWSCSISPYSARELTVMSVIFFLRSLFSTNMTLSLNSSASFSNFKQAYSTTRSLFCWREEAHSTNWVFGFSRSTPSLSLSTVPICLPSMKARALSARNELANSKGEADLNLSFSVELRGIETLSPRHMLWTRKSQAELDPASICGLLRDFPEEDRLEWGREEFLCSFLVELSSTSSGEDESHQLGSSTKAPPPRLARMEYCRQQHAFVSTAP